ncbi:hypothetical protein Y032_0589g374 [Ancylostoma ceylanicum]|uniref:Uncharacterized protein n=1 Tax=Ancylostoma ceylanicum TaxID=53326 RepID=A0A016WMP5_9BILA|nr:hypothetical protein Y032_0589g374 [Ancylostoma ceylanicum]
MIGFVLTRAAEFLHERDYHCFDHQGSEFVDLSPTTKLSGTVAFCRLHPCVEPERANAFCIYATELTTYEANKQPSSSKHGIQQRDLTILTRNFLQMQQHLTTQSFGAQPVDCSSTPQKNSKWSKSAVHMCAFTYQTMNQSEECFFQLQQCCSTISHRYKHGQTGPDNSTTLWNAKANQNAKCSVVLFAENTFTTSNAGL